MCLVLYPLGTLESHGWAHSKCAQNVPTGHIGVTQQGIFKMYPTFDYWAYWNHTLPVLSMCSQCAQWVFGPLSPVSMPDIVLQRNTTHLSLSGAGVHRPPRCTSSNTQTSMHPTCSTSATICSCSRTRRYSGRCFFVFCSRWGRGCGSAADKARNREAMRRFGGTCMQVLVVILDRTYLGVEMWKSRVGGEAGL